MDHTGPKVAVRRRRGRLPLRHALGGVPEGKGWMIQEGGGRVPEAEGRRIKGLKTTPAVRRLGAPSSGRRPAPRAARARDAGPGRRPARPSWKRRAWSRVGGPPRGRLDDRVAEVHEGRQGGQEGHGPHRVSPGRVTDAVRFQPHRSAPSRLGRGRATSGIRRSPEISGRSPLT